MPDPAADTAGVLAWPPLIFAGPLIAGLGLQQVRPIRLPSRPSRPVSVVAIGLAGAMMVWAIRELRRAGTDVSPYQPTTAIVTAGPYRFSRNPIYLSLALLSAGIAGVTRAGWPLAFLPVAIATVQRGVIEREERYLDRTFEEEYRRYRARVRRWL